jgi:hypothetical protein
MRIRWDILSNEFVRNNMLRVCPKTMCYSVLPSLWQPVPIWVGTVLWWIVQFGVPYLPTKPCLQLNMFTSKCLKQRAAVESKDWRRAQPPSPDTKGKLCIKSSLLCPRRHTTLKQFLYINVCIYIYPIYCKQGQVEWTLCFSLANNCKDTCSKNKRTHHYILPLYTFMVCMEEILVSNIFRSPWA